MTDDAIAKLYLQRRPTRDNHAAILEELTTRTGKSIAQIRSILVSKRVYKTGADFKSPADRERDEKLSSYAQHDREQRTAASAAEVQAIRDSLARISEQQERPKTFSEMMKEGDRQFNTPTMPIEIMAVVFLIALVIAGIGAIFH